MADSGIPREGISRERSAQVKLLPSLLRVYGEQAVAALELLEAVEDPTCLVTDCTAWSAFNAMVESMQVVAGGEGLDPRMTVAEATEMSGAVLAEVLTTGESVKLAARR